MLGYTVVDPPSIIATHLTEVIRSAYCRTSDQTGCTESGEQFKGKQSCHLWTSWCRSCLGWVRFRKYYRICLREGISIRDLLTIFETLADHAATTRDTDVLTEYVRQSLKRAISSKYFPSNETTSVITLDPKVEQDIMGIVSNRQNRVRILHLDPERTKAIMASVETEVAKLESLGKNPIVVTSPIVQNVFQETDRGLF